MSNISGWLVPTMAAGAWAYLCLMVLLTAHWRRRRLAKQQRRLPEARPKRVRIVRPCAGDEPDLLDALLSVAKTTRRFPIEVVMAVDSPQDTALPTIRVAVQTLVGQGIPARLHIPPLIGANRKVSLLAGCADVEGADFDILLSADANVDMTGYDLDALVAHLGDEGTGAVWAPFYEDAATEHPGNRVSAAILNRSWHSFGLLGRIDTAGMVGKLFAVRRSTLDEIGGFQAMVSYLGEDMQMGRLLARAGYRVVAAPAPVRTLSGPKTRQETLARHTRWMMVIKTQRRALLAAYPLLFCSNLLILPLAAMGAVTHPILAASSALFALAVRGLAAWSAELLLGLPRPSRGVTPAGLFRLIRDIFSADILLAQAFLRVLGTRQIQWRGHWFAFDANGRMVPLTEKPTQ